MSSWTFTASVEVVVTDEDDIDRYDELPFTEQGKLDDAVKGWVEGFFMTTEDEVETLQGFEVRVERVDVD